MGKSLRSEAVPGRRSASKRVWWAFLKAPVFWIALAMVLLFAVFIRHQFALNDELIREEASTADLERQSPDMAWDSSWPTAAECRPARGRNDRGSTGALCVRRQALRHPAVHPVLLRLSARRPSQQRGLLRARPDSDGHAGVGRTRLHVRDLPRGHA